MEDLAEHGEEILVLKDSLVLEEGEDELVSVQVEEKERLRKNLDNKTKKQLYNAYKEDDTNDSLLSQYDEEILGPKKKVRRGISGIPM